MLKRDYYEVLEIARRASGEEIRRAFLKKAMAYHPDRNRGPDAEEKFKEANEAYHVLIDPMKRARYDLGFSYTGVGSNGGFTGDFESAEDFRERVRQERRRGFRRDVRTIVWSVVVSIIGCTLGLVGLTITILDNTGLGPVEVIRPILGIPLMFWGTYNISRVLMRKAMLSRSRARSIWWILLSATLGLIIGVASWGIATLLW